MLVGLNSDAQTKGSIQFVVIDSQTGDLLDSAMIENSVIGKNTSVYTDEMGEGHFSGLDNSEYFMMFFIWFSLVLI